MRGEWGSCGVSSANEYSFTHGAQINFGDLTSYLTYGFVIWQDGADLSADNSEEVLNEFKFLTQSEVYFRFRKKHVNVCFPPILQF